jgi:hypothetical protein
MKALLALAVLAASAAGAAWPEKDESKEPPQIFTLEVEGKRIPVDLDVPVDLPSKSVPVRVVLRSEPHRQFEAAGVRFRYPRAMGFEADFGDPPVRLWTLDGNDAVLILQHHEAERDPVAALSAVADAMADQYGKALRERVETRLTLGGRELKGTTLRVVLGASPIRQSLYSFKAGRGSIVIVLQDSPKEDGSPSEEFTRLLDMLKASFELPAEVK